MVSRGGGGRDDKHRSVRMQGERLVLSFLRAFLADVPIGAAMLVMQRTVEKDMHSGTGKTGIR